MINNQSEQINELALALSLAQGEIEPALKDSSNPFFKSKYADLSEIIRVCKPVLPKFGLCVIQTINYITGEQFLVTTLGHKSGQWIKGFLRIKPMKEDMQALGSAITYARRYSLSAIVGVSAEDDDGNAAVVQSTSKPSVQIPKAYNSSNTDTAGTIKVFVSKPVEQPINPSKEQTAELEPISKEEGKHLMAVANKNGWGKEEVVGYIVNNLGYANYLDLNTWDYEDVLKQFSVKKIRS